MIESIRLPAYRVGNGVVAQSADAFRELGTRALIIGGKTAFEAALNQVQTACAQAGVEIVSTEWYGGECTHAHMDRLAAIGRAGKADLVVGIGGGKALDTAKGCADQLNVPIITVPTIAATCAAVTSLSVVYDDEGVYIESMLEKRPAACALIDPDIIAHAPSCYLRAGMGDAMAKHVESMMASRGRTLTHTCTLAVTIGQTAFYPILQYGVQAMQDVDNHIASEALKQVILSNIISTGLTSILIEDVYNGAVAHATFYALTHVPGFEKNNLHGDAVGFGILVQQMMEGKMDSFRELRAFAAAVGLPLTAREMGVELSDGLLEKIIPSAIRLIEDNRLMPYEITPEMYADAMWAVENYQK